MQILGTSLVSGTYFTSVQKTPEVFKPQLLEDSSVSLGTVLLNKYKRGVRYTSPESAIEPRQTTTFFRISIPVRTQKAE